MSNASKRLVLLISGRGSNMEAFLSATKQGTLAATIACVISNRPTAPGLQTAQSANIPTECIDHTTFATREAFDTVLGNVIEAYQPDMIVLAGFMRILTERFVARFAGKLINIHPSLLPKYPGLNTHQRALDAGDSEAGATVHYVTPELDGGPSILQARVVINADDDAESLAQRILPLEHAIYPVAAQLHLSGRLALSENRVTLDGLALPPSGLDWDNDKDRYTP
jgi:phosphoribosylglycinamide formyltransferase-1